MEEIQALLLRRRFRDHKTLSPVTIEAPTQELAHPIGGPAKFGSTRPFTSPPLSRLTRSPKKGVMNEGISEGVSKDSSFDHPSAVSSTSKTRKSRRSVVANGPPANGPPDKEPPSGAQNTAPKTSHQAVVDLNNTVVQSIKNVEARMKEASVWMQSQTKPNGKRISILTTAKLFNLPNPRLNFILKHRYIIVEPSILYTQIITHQRATLHHLETVHDSTDNSENTPSSTVYLDLFSRPPSSSDPGSHSSVAYLSLSQSLTDLPSIPHQYSSLLSHVYSPVTHVPHVQYPCLTPAHTSISTPSTETTSSSYIRHSPPPPHQF
ncbi:hypothetical protein FRC03_001686 [Tulasnella sp. 419]|nr:hypothetical protein FRC03_001686 [Tulasnella sp. 419]